MKIQNGISLKGTTPAAKLAEREPCAPSQPSTQTTALGFICYCDIIPVGCAIPLVHKGVCLDPENSALRRSLGAYVALDRSSY